MNSVTIKLLIDYAAEKHIYIEDIVRSFLAAEIDIDVYYNCLAGRIRQQTSSY